MFEQSYYLMKGAPHSQESYFKAMANAPIVVAEGEEELEVDYDSDGYPILPERSKVRYDSLYFDNVLTCSF